MERGAMKQGISIILCTSLLIAGCSTGSGPSAGTGSEKQVPEQSVAAPETTEAFAVTTEEKEETETTQQEEPEVRLEDSWRTIYLEQLETGPNDDPEAKYGLIYVNDDDIPELAVKSREKGDSYYTCGKEGVDELHIDPEDMNAKAYFHENDNKLEVLKYDLKTGKKPFMIYRIENGKWESVSTGDDEPDDSVFPIKESSEFYGGSTYEQMKAYLSGNGPSDHRAAFKELCDSSGFSYLGGKNYEEYAIYDLGNDGSMELIGITKDEAFSSVDFGIASFKDGLVSVVEQGSLDTLMDTAVVDIDASTLSRSSMMARFSAYEMYEIKNCTMLRKYSITGEPTSAPAGDDELQGWSYNPDIDGEYMFEINGLNKGESFVSDIIHYWKSKQSSNRKCIASSGYTDQYAPDPCDPMEFKGFNAVVSD